MASSDSGHIFEVEPENMNGELEDGEQNLEDEANEMLNVWNESQMMKEVAEEREQLKLEKERKCIEFYDGETDFEEIAKDMVLLEGETTYIKFLERNPEGKKVFCDCTIAYDHASYLEYDMSPFASSIYDGKPAKLNLLEGPCTVGLIQALNEMREGERANILILPDGAYGKHGALPLIPPNASIFCQVKVHKVWDCSSLEVLIHEERAYEMEWEAPLESKLKYIEEHKNLANTFLKDNEPREAIVRYKAAIKCLDELNPELLEKHVKVSTLMMQLLHNSANALNSLGMHKSATKYARRALFMDPRNLKAYYQLIKSRIGLADYSGARSWIEKVDKISPNNASFVPLKIQLDKARNAERQKSEEIMMRIAKGYFGNK